MQGEMDTFNQLLLEYPQLMYGGVGATAFVAGGTLIYKIATRKKPTHVNVNCWFCDQNTVVPYGNRNCWDCPTCDQYNGFQENGDYNKPIPAQYMEHLNHGVSAGFPSGLPEAPKTLQWVNCQMLLCKKCNNNQSLKIKQLASFIPREDENYDEEIEVYKHHLEQTYKLCRPCQTAVEYYIKHQNRQLRGVVFNHQLQRSRDSDKAFVRSSYSLSTPPGVTLLRILAFLICAFLVVAMAHGPGDTIAPPSSPQTLSGGVVPPKPTPLPSNASAPQNGSVEAVGRAVGRAVGQAVRALLDLLPSEALERAEGVWLYGRSHKMAVASVGLLACVSGVFLAGSVRLRRIDALSSVLWFLVWCLYLAEQHLRAHGSGWLDAAHLSAASLCCLVGLAAAVPTRKSTGPRRARGRRYLSGGSPGHLYGLGPSPFVSPVSPAFFVPKPPPNLSRLISQQQGSRERRASPSSLPGRLNRALFLGTIPSLARTDSGYLFSGSRPPSQCKDSPSSDYFSLKSGSRPSSPGPSLGPSPAPSVASSVTSSSSSAWRRRPLISPARLNISGQKLRLFSHDPEPVAPPLAPPLFHTPPTSFHSSGFSPDVSPFHSQNDLSGLLREASVLEEPHQRGSSSGSSACLVDTTTGTDPDDTTTSKGWLSRVLWPGVLVVSLGVNLFFSSLYLYRNWT